MTKQETGRSLLRAFKIAADYTKQGTTSTPERAWAEYAIAYASASSSKVGRRYRVNERNLAHALATAWGL